MEQRETTSLDICILDYLVGTLATAYKGVITSLVAKDFCIRQSDNIIFLTGVVLSMPPGEYTAALLEEGREIERTRLKNGVFEMSIAERTIAKAENLQLDIIQAGRHIGTFLLKRESTGGSFTSALEISGELKGMNFRRLTSLLQNREGLLRRAEEIISKIHSSKKEWRAFSEDLNSFGRDLFWADRDAFAAWYPALLRYSIRACVNTEKPDLLKPLVNLLSLISLQLEKEENAQKLKFFCDEWLRQTAAAAVDFSPVLSQTTKVLSGINEKCPSADLSEIIRQLLSSVRKKIEIVPVLQDSIIGIMSDFVPDPDLARLKNMSGQSRNGLLDYLSSAEALVDNKAVSGVLSILGRIGTTLSNPAETAETFLDVVEKNLSEESAPAFSKALIEAFPVLVPEPSSPTRAAARKLADILIMAARLGLTEFFEALADGIEQCDSRVKEEIFLNSDISSAVLSSGSADFLAVCIRILKGIRIPAPRVEGFSNETWAEMVNPRHVENLGKLMEIVSLDCRKFRDILIQVICNLTITGVHIPDDRIFQRRVSSFLNSEAPRAEFLLCSMLLRMLPVYFNEVGATGRLRDYTTAIDAWGNDPVLYFVRKQVHVNASNYNIALIEAVMKCWFLQDQKQLEGAVPDDVIRRLDPGLLARYSRVIRKIFLERGIYEDRIYFERIKVLAEDDLQEFEDDDKEAAVKAVLLLRIYRELLKKYSRAQGEHGYGLRPAVARLSELAGIILSEEKTRPDELFYFKRHIAFGIPSVMGTYREAKFDAFGEALRREEDIRIAAEQVILKIPKNGSRSDFQNEKRLIDDLDSLHALFELYGLGNFQVKEIVTILKTDTLASSQVIDMLRMWQRELSWITEYFYHTFHHPLISMLRSMPLSDIPERLKGPGAPGTAFLDRATDILLRDLVTGIPGFTELDRLIDALIKALAGAADKGVQPDREGPGADFYVLDELSEGDAMRLGPAIGAKAKNLVYLGKKGLNVPPGIVLPAENTFRDPGAVASPELLKSIIKKIEERSGSVFGDSVNPLFVSVRSGCYVSMPGILSTVLHCGMNDITREALIKKTGDARLGWDSYRRFIENYAVIVLGLDPKIFADISSSVLRQSGLTNGVAGIEELKDTSRLYLGALQERGLALPGDVYAQLRACVTAVYASWNSQRALQFRKVTNISEHWGTSVLIMQMVNGNAEGAGASVFFTRVPRTGERRIYGDAREAATGADIVYGSLINRPLSIIQAGDGRMSLEESDPELYRLLQNVAARIEAVFEGLPQEVEITYTSKRNGEKIIWLLQARRMESYRGQVDRFDEVCRMEERVIGRGAGVHGGALSGVAALSSSPEEIKDLKRRSGLPAILLRSMASTDDIALMSEVEGIVTSAGGVASHAAVLAQKFDLTAVVGCLDMQIIENEKHEVFARFGQYEIRDGAPLSMNGSAGLVYSGMCPVAEES